MDNCKGCSQPMPNNSGGLTALGHIWHKECFKCKLCGVRLFSFSKFYDEDEKPVCIKCHNEKLPTCAACHKRIEDGFYQMEEKYYHGKCFNCTGCGKTLADGDAFEDGQKLWHLLCFAAKQKSGQ